MNNDQKRTVLAFVLTGVIVFTWQYLFSPQTQVQPETQTNTNTEKVVSTNTSSNTAIATQVNEVKNFDNVTLKNDSGMFIINSDFSIKDASGYKTSMSLSELSKKPNFFSVRYVNTANALESFNLKFSDSSSTEKLTAIDEQRGVSVDFTLTNDGKLQYRIYSEKDFTLSYTMSAEEQQSDNRTYSQYIFFANDVERFSVGEDDNGDGSLKWLGLDFNHHAFFNVFSKKETIKYLSTENGDMVFQTVTPMKEMRGYLLYSLKSYDQLLTHNDTLDLSIDFGIFGLFSVPILKSMQWMYGYVGNYGVAIIILTVIIRLAMYPLQAKSFKSMKKMQKLQPEIQKLKEKYADDPMKQQKETMELFKRSGASPLGGCLPMILQIPIFIAFYQAISNSVELVGSPFYFWLTDLSAKDPYYILPAIMGITMLAQTKLNPSTSADPNQQKIMYIMPIVFIFIMKDLPAGLNLYFTVSNILGIAQQLYVYKSADV